MKAVFIFSFLVLLAFGLSGCRPGIRSTAETAGQQTLAEQPSETPLPGHDLPSEQGLAASQPTSTSASTQERLMRSYPAPIGFPAFRCYCQIRCYPGYDYGPTPTSSSAAIAQLTRQRPYRSYPAPTGLPGFRRNYQIRCCPGCHASNSAPPVPTPIHR